MTRGAEIETMRLITPMPNTVETGRVPPPASRESTADKTLGVYLSHQTLASYGM